VPEVGPDRSVFGAFECPPGGLSEAFGLLPGEKLLSYGPMPRAALAIMGLLLAALVAVPLPRIANHVLVSTSSHTHFSVHSHGGLPHVHPHTHSGPQSIGASTRVTACSVYTEVSRDEHDCGCHSHGHTHSSREMAIRTNSRDTIPTPVAYAESPVVIPVVAIPDEHRHRWPLARGRPPDQLIQIRTVVLLT
jgi:hypothetical protein